MFAQLRRSVRRETKAVTMLAGGVAAAALLAGTLVAGASGAGLSASGAALSAPGGYALPDSVPKLVSLARSLGSLDPAGRVEILLPLRLSNAAGLNDYVHAEYKPGSADYRHFLTPRAFGKRFGASTGEAERATRALELLGFTVATPAANRLYLSAIGTVAAAERAFGTRLARFMLPGGSRFYANTGAIRLPGALRGLVTGVIGLDDSALPRPQLSVASRRAVAGARAKALARLRALRGAAAPVGQDGGATPCQQAVASGGYTAPQLAQGYDFNGLYANGFHGEGMSAALVEFDDFHDSNVATMEQCYGVTTPVTRRLVEGGTGGPPGEGEAEDMADITTILELDPGLTHLYVYEAPITGGAALLDEGTAELALYNAYVSDDTAPVLSSSWGNCEETQSQSYDQLFAMIAEEAAAQGQQIFDASGDSGAVDCRGFPAPTLGSISVEQEAAVPWITGVGGTDLSVGTANGTASTHNEDTWNDAGAGGGGQSAVWAMPSWQQSYLTATHDSVAGATNDCGAPSGQLCRMVPDISMNADPDAGGAVNGGPTPPQFASQGDVGSPGDDTYCATSNCSLTTLVGAPPLPIGAPPPAGAGGWYPIGGTSLATPTAAAAAVLWDQEAKAAGLGSFGFLNPSLYEIASDKTKFGADFHDITTDTNDDQYDSSDCPAGCNPRHLYSAGTGYDMASGLGSVDAAKLGADLVKQAELVAVTPSTEQMYGYLKGPHTTEPVSVTSGFLHSSYTATSNARWLHVSSPGTLPSKLSWYVDPTGLSSGTYHGAITVTGKGGSATLSVTYSVGPRAKISVVPATLRFSERAIDSNGASTTPTCGSTTWNDELKNSSSLNGSSDTTPVDSSTRQTLQIANAGPSGSTLHYEAFLYTDTSSWLTEDLNPGNNPSGFQTSPSQPLVPTQGAIGAGSPPVAFKLASIANANAAGGYPRMNQGTYTGAVQIRDLADPTVVVTVPVTLVLGNGTGTPTIAASPASISLHLDPGKSTTVNLVLSDASGVCGYAYSLSSTQSWATFNGDLQSGTVGASPATAAPSSVTDTGQGNGYTPIAISAAHLGTGVYHATLFVQSQNAVHNPTTVPITLTVGHPTRLTGHNVCTRTGKLSFVLHPPRHTRVVQALVYVNGRLVHRFRGRRLRRLTFAKPKPKSYSLKIVTVLSDGERWQRTAHLSGCRETRVRLKRLHAAKKSKKSKKSIRQVVLRPAFTG